MMRMSCGFALAISVLLTLGCGDGVPPEEEGPSIAKGGRLYDKFWKVSSANEPTETHPMWATRPDLESNARIAADTWRCKECHGWDYRGKDGAYARGSHRTGFDGVFGSTTSQAEVVTSLAEAHGYRAAGLSDVELESLALFAREGLVDTGKWIDEQGVFRGDAERGKQLFLEGLGGNKSCKTCHGEDGLKIPKGSPTDYDDFVGKIATKNPWEFLHKVRFGQPGTKMPAASASGAPLQDIIDLAAYSQTLPTAK